MSTRRLCDSTASLRGLAHKTPLRCAVKTAVPVQFDRTDAPMELKTVQTGSGTDGRRASHIKQLHRQVQFWNSWILSFSSEPDRQSQDAYPCALIDHFYWENLAWKSCFRWQILVTTRAQTSKGFASCLNLHIGYHGSRLEATSVPSVARSQNRAVLLFSERRCRPEVGLCHQTRSSVAASFSQAGWQERKKKKREEICHLLRREKTQQAFLLQTNLWRCIDMRLVSRCLVDPSDCCYCQPHPNTIFIFIFFPPTSTSNLSAI